MPNNAIALLKSRRVALRAVGYRLPRNRRVPRPLQPTGIEREYYEIILGLIDPLFQNIKEKLIPVIPEIIRQYKEEMRIDSAHIDMITSFGELITRTISEIRINIALRMPNISIQSKASDIAHRVAIFNKNQLDRQFKSVLGINPLVSERWLEPHVSAFVEKNVSLIKSITEEHLTKIEQMVRHTVERGVSTSTLEEEIYAQFEVTNSRAHLIARDQISKYNGKLTELRQTGAGVKEYIWSTSKDERVRSRHAAVDGQTFSWSEPGPPVGNNGEHLHPGEDFQCIPSDVKILIFSDIKRTFRRLYTEELTTIITDSGISFNATPNHPVLSGGMWKALKELNVGDYIFKAQLNLSFLFEKNVKNMIPTIKEIFDFLFLLNPIERIIGFTSQFHGDGTNKNVDVISFNNGLMNIFNTSIPQTICQEFLTKANVAFIDLPSFGNFFSVFNTLFCSTDCDMSFFSKLFSVINTEFTHSDDISFTAISRLNAISKEMSSDSIPLYSILFGNSEFAHTRNIIPDSRFYRELFGIVRRAIFSGYGESISAEYLTEITSVDSQSSCHLGENHPFIIKPLRIVEKFSSIYSGHVYNLETVNGWYSANDIITKNCRCTALPVLDEFLK